ncbi:diaminopimelate epimerase [Maribacter algicola]|uniref:Diaminopimelate epimerase n=1 Tax=Meishania litoralis TaxID=3434685 RepID=A0ACC7LKY1_9FLAO
MKLTFFKYQGTGNDFIMIDDRSCLFPKNDTNLVSFLCDRKFGIGADGLILLQNDEMSDFSMVYFNADGKEGSLCGNGGRCAVAFAKYLGIIDTQTTFKAVDGLHQALIEETTVSLQMQDVEEIKAKPNYFFLDTGSPHHVQMVESLEGLKVFEEGKKLRYGLYGKKGSNINFVSQKNEGTFSIRTYERGVENETLSCGTGVTAVALAMHRAKNTTMNSIRVNTLGGELKVTFEIDGRAYRNINLIGPAQQVFKGEIEC